VAVYSVTTKTDRVKAAAAKSPRVVVSTDAAQAERVPESVRRAADLISLEDRDIFACDAQAGGADGVIAWVEGDELSSGSSEELRCVFLPGAPVKVFVPVHIPCLAEADLIGLQPRLYSPGASKETVIRSCGIRGAVNPSALARKSWESCSHPWARLYAALLSERIPGAGIEALRQIWLAKKSTPLFSSLVLRNLIVALIRKNQTKQAEELLGLGAKAFPGYAELLYLSAVLWMHRQKPSNAFAELERAVRVTGSGEYVGSGGESSYRSSWLLGTIYEQMGEEGRAASCFLAGLLQRPAFPPSVSGILRQRFSRFRATQLSQPLCEMARREPAYLEAVFNFFLQHRVFDSPRRLLRTMQLPADFRERLQERLSSAEPRTHSTKRGEGARPGVILEGPFLSVSGHARINRALGCSLLDAADLDAALEPTEAGTANTKSLPDFPRIAEGLRRNPTRLDLTIRHCWPPDFRSLDSGRLACILPWEHRAVPRSWVREIERSVDELWVPSDFVSTAFIDGGVSRDRVHVIPNGFSPDVFHREVKLRRPEGCRSCVFLFVGGTIRRKGADLLLQAYADAFSSDDDVTLIFKDTGASGFYQHNNLVAQIRKLADKPGAAHMLLLTEAMDDAALASLYRGCDAFVLPYRGEGFGMPLVEAMACGKPVITTAAGPALEFCSSESAYLISARETAVPDEPPPFGEFTSEWTWFEPDLVELAAALRAVYENRGEAARKGTLAATRIARTHAWPEVMKLYFDRIARLTGLSGATVGVETSGGLRQGNLAPVMLRA
jgi:glycosyltransferase involved in cell wall biosynthesis